MGVAEKHGLEPTHTQTLNMKRTLVGTTHRGTLKGTLMGEPTAAQGSHISTHSGTLKGAQRKTLVGTQTSEPTKEPFKGTPRGNQHGNIDNDTNVFFSDHHCNHQENFHRGVEGTLGEPSLEPTPSSDLEEGI
jgi:hypothetical protein